MACNIIIHRGTKQIGGCVTEIRTEKARILIDLGTELPGEDGKQPEETLDIDGLTKDCDAVFFTHYHGDHMGNIGCIRSEVPLYMGSAAREISMVLSRRLQKAHKHYPNEIPSQKDLINALERANIFSSIKDDFYETIQVGDIRITPYRADHSAFDSYMFLVEADGSRILHTGDFREHGFTGKDLMPMLNSIGQVDVLISEGTMLSRPSESVLTEEDLMGEAEKIIKENRNVFVLCSSTNIDRIKAFTEAATKVGRVIICDLYQKEVLNAVEGFSPIKGVSYDFKNVTKYKKNSPIIKESYKKGFVSFIRSNKNFNRILEAYNQGGYKYKIIYSMWRGYRYGETQNKDVVNLLANCRNEDDIIMLHTSGHATEKTLKALYEAVMPSQGLIPIHSETPERFSSLIPDVKIINLEDGVPYKI